VLQQLVTINKERHAGTKIKDLVDFKFAAQFHIAYVTMHEFARGAANFPVVFIEDKAQGEFRPVALLGLNPSDNLFVDATGQWQGSYVPAIIRRHPFALAPAGPDGQHVICIDEASSLVSQTEGAALFDSLGQPTQVIDNVRRYLSDLQKMDTLTHNFCKFLKANHLLSPLNMRVRDKDKLKNVAGCHIVNEERVNLLSDELHLEMKRQGYLAPLFAHLISLAQLERLVKLQDERSPSGPER
jgi:hypothetical protein